MREKFKEFEDDFETRMFTEQLIYTFLSQLGYDNLLTNREKTTSALESINPNPIFNLLNSKIYVKKTKNAKHSTEVPERKRKDRRKRNDSYSSKRNEVES